MTGDSVSEIALAYSSAQAVLFAASPSRAELLGMELPPAVGPALRINVWRNHAFETVARLAEPYLAWGELAFEWNYSNYDDTFSFEGFDSFAGAAAELLWLDPSRVVEIDWLLGRLTTLRRLSRAPLLIVGALPKLPKLPDVEIADLVGLCEAEGVKLLDRRLSKVAGTSISAGAQVQVARALAGRWLPSILLPPIKAVAVDLDNTLYEGVLGEDGLDGVQLTPEHAKFQRFLLELKFCGIFLALVSRNEKDDVRALFAARNDFPLSWTDFSFTEVSWGEKSVALLNFARQLNIDPSAVVFVDDNPGELCEVATHVPAIHRVCAHTDASVTQRALAHLPGLWRWRVGTDDLKRVADQSANTTRIRLAEDLDPEAYLRSLDVSLNYSLNPNNQLDRMAEMSRKTNQFNLALARLSEFNYAERLADAGSAIVTVGLIDRLADSGVIALLAVHREGRSLFVDELLISCRAMGRRLEDPIIMGALQVLPELSEVDELVFSVVDGPRNQPARRWLSTWAGFERELAPPGQLRLPAAIARDYVAPAAITLNTKY